MGLRRRLLVVQLLSLLIVSAGAGIGWWLGQTYAMQATRKAHLAERQSRVLAELSIALLDSLPFGPSYLLDSSPAAVRFHLQQDREGLRRYRDLLDSRLSDLLLAGIQPEVHEELEEIRLLTVQAEALLRGAEKRLNASATPGDSLPTGLLEALVRQPSLWSLKGHSTALNALLQKVMQERSSYDLQQDAALATGNRVMLLALLLAWVGGLLFALRTSERILQPLELLEQTMRKWVGREAPGPIDLTPFRRAPREIASLAKSFHHLGQRMGSLVERLEGMALSDGLTGVANRRRFDLALRHEWQGLQSHRGSLSLLMIDVDHFKAYNDTYGHDQGDRCLIQVAAAIRSQGQRSSDLTCRIGGEEFALLLPGTSGDEAFRIAERTCRSVRELAIPHLALGETGRVSVSIGVATADPAVDREPRSLQLRADSALYRRKKREGRDGVSVASPQDLCIPDAG